MGEPGALWGTFSEPGNLAVGDPYDKGKATKMPRHSGKQFTVAPPRAGSAPDAWLDHAVRSLGEGAPYTDAWILEKRLARAAGKPVSDKAFVTLVKTHGGISCGPGSADGCLNPVPFDTDGSAAAKKSAPPRRPADKLKNIYTAGPKTGGFGRPWKDRSLGEPPAYYPDVYDGGRLKEKEMAAKAKEAAKEKPMRPFVSAGSPRRVFAPDAFLAPLAGDAPAAGKGGAAEGRGSAPRPWRSGGPPKQGAAFCVFSNVGRDFVPDPVPEAKFHRKVAVEKPFRPVGSCHNRLSMRDINPYSVAPRPAPDVDFTLFATGG
ncbi:hypothetical protein Rsub_11450 [Raphidocelis subcapitata]|uniref:Cilia-and flagella-associated protein 96 n=1 Tax=Raphidocelis subcapitata TaxID=307507 RepID=A0A2V0PGF9_9CHLO|nr:hypothetical protein Rsub_11450 [Raphidocelis subcapitata]|eukprot:GBF98846.1 hypothetical protein Rsub_11450 [Raphidocelis subcapitata]